MQPQMRKIQKRDEEARSRWLGRLRPSRGTASGRPHGQKAGSEGDLLAWSPQHDVSDPEPCHGKDIAPDRISGKHCRQEQPSLEGQCPIWRSNVRNQIIGRKIQPPRSKQPIRRRQEAAGVAKDLLSFTFWRQSRLRRWTRFQQQDIGRHGLGFQGSD